jgi:hypothetical protein
VVLELLPLALAAALWPVLLAVVAVALRSPQRTKLLACFLAGGLVATVSIGLLIVYALDGSALVTSDESTTNSAVDIVVGALALGLAVVMKRREPSREAPAREGKSTKRVEAMLERGPGWAFLAGVVLDIAPSPFALVALAQIAEWDYTFGRNFVTILCFYLVVFIVIELPLIGSIVAPEGSAVRVTRFNTWLSGHWYRLAIYALGAGGAYLTTKGIIESLG